MKLIVPIRNVFFALKVMFLACASVILITGCDGASATRPAQWIEGEWRVDPSYAGLLFLDEAGTSFGRHIHIEKKILRDVGSGRFFEIELGSTGGEKAMITFPQLKYGVEFERVSTDRIVAKFSFARVAFDRQELKLQNTNPDLLSRLRTLWRSIRGKGGTDEREFFGEVKIPQPKKNEHEVPKMAERSDQPVSGEPYNGGVYLYRERVEDTYWNDWSAYPTTGSPTGQQELTIFGEGKTVDFVGNISINCENGKYFWRSAGNFGDFLKSEIEVEERIPSVVINKAIDIFCKNRGIRK